MGTAINHPVPDRVKQSFVIVDIRALMHQSVWMSKITNDGLTRSGTGCFLAVPNYPYGKSGHQRVNMYSSTMELHLSYIVCRLVCLYVS